jgi:hypothetical protein
MAVSDNITQEWTIIYHDNLSKITLQSWLWLVDLARSTALRMRTFFILIDQNPTVLWVLRRLAGIHSVAGRGGQKWQPMRSLTHASPGQAFLVVVCSEVNGRSKNTMQ